MFCKHSQSSVKPLQDPHDRRKISFREESVAYGLCSLFFIFWVIVLCIKHAQFKYYDWDLALSSNILWSLSQGHFFSSLLGAHFLANHANYIAFLIAPIFKIFPHPLTLVFLKVLSFSLASFMVYKIARKPLGFIPAVALMGAYFIYPANISAIWFDFDFENFSALAFLLLFYFFFEGNLKFFLWTCFFTCLIKENAPLAVIFFGLFALGAKKEKRLFWAGIPVGLGLLFFLGSVFFVIPHFRKDFLMPHAYLDSYAYVGSSAENIGGWDLLVSRVFHGLWNDVNIQFFIVLFSPLIISLLSPEVLFVGLPLFLQNFLSSKLPQRMIYFHYAASLAPFIFVATMVSLKKIKKKMGECKCCAVLIFILALCCCHVFLYQQASFSQKYFSRFQRQDLQRMMKDRLQARSSSTNTNFYKKKFLDEISPADSVIATFEFLPCLSTRDQIFSFHNFLENRNPVTGVSPFYLPDHLDYALIDFDDRWIFFEAGQRRFVQARKFLESDWSVARAAGSVVLFCKAQGRGEKIFSFGNEFKNSGLMNYSVDPYLELSFVQIGDWDQELRTLSIDLFWRCLKKTNEVYGMVFFLQGNGEEVFFYPREVGYGLWPVATWEEDVGVKEKVWLPMPQVSDGEYRLKVQLFSLPKDKGRGNGRQLGPEAVDIGAISYKKGSIVP